MTAVEGVVKYIEHFTPGLASQAPEVIELIAWRSILYDLNLIGHDPVRYDGAGYGNASVRLSADGAARGHRKFLVTGTQTGHLSRLEPRHVALVEQYDLEANKVVASGPAHPSSEALTHGSVYDHAPAIRWVMHAHSPIIWRHRKSLDLPTTDPAVPYGTPEMAREVGRLFAEADLDRHRAFVMGGHLDGVVTFGVTASEAASRMISILARARSLGGER